MAQSMQQLNSALQTAGGKNINSEFTPHYIFFFAKKSDVSVYHIRCLHRFLYKILVIYSTELIWVLGEHKLKIYPYYAYVVLLYRKFDALLLGIY